LTIRAACLVLPRQDVKLRFKSRLPWAVAFSFSRAIQQPAGEIWKGQEGNVRPHSRLCITARVAIGLRARAITLPRWRRNDGKQAQQPGKN
jgi:fructose-bisphosphate aldolase class I